MDDDPNAFFCRGTSLSPWVQAISPSLSIEREVTSTINRQTRQVSGIHQRRLLGTLVHRHTLPQVLKPIERDSDLRWSNRVLKIRGRKDNQELFTIRSDVVGAKHRNAAARHYLVDRQFAGIRKSKARLRMNIYG